MSDAKTSKAKVTKKPGKTSGEKGKKTKDSPRKPPHVSETSWIKPAKAHESGDKDFGEWVEEVKGQNGDIQKMRQGLAVAYAALFANTTTGRGALKDVQRLLHRGNKKLLEDTPLDWTLIRNEALRIAVLAR